MYLVFAYVFLQINDRSPFMFHNHLDDEFILDKIMASFMIRRIFQRSFSRTTFQHASSSSVIQRQIIQEDGKLN